MTTEQKTLIAKRMDNEIVDTLCPLIKSAFKLINEDINNEFTYTYLLSFATAIERLQKIIYILKEVKDNKPIPDLREFGHDTIKLYNSEIKAIIPTISNDENILITKALDIIDSLVLVPKARYANFGFDEANESFEIPLHITKILDNPMVTDNVDSIKLSRNILSIILKKYIASLVDLIWHKKVNLDIEIYPICLQEFITKEYLELDLNVEIQSIIDKENSDAQKRVE